MIIPLHLSRGWHLLYPSLFQVVPCSKETYSSNDIHRSFPFLFFLQTDDARQLEVAEAEKVRIVSPRGAITVPVKISGEVKPVEVFIPFHYSNWDGEASVNELTIDAVDPLSHQPMLKHASCRVEKI